MIQDARNNINSQLTASGVQRAARANFWFSGTYTASSYPVRYTGKNGAADKVTIKASQTQSVPNDASHIGEDGDFGIATATKPAGGGAYAFALDHKAAYITFMPYTAQTWGANAVIQKIRIFTGNTSDALAGTFDLADDGTLSNPVSTSNSIELDVKGGSWNGGFSIPSTETYATNAATMVINPGTYSNVSIEYTLYDPASNVTGTITKTYPSVTFTAGRNKKVKTDLQVKVYNTQDGYYMWDAQQQYWYGHKSAQTKTNNTSDPTNSWPQSKAADSDRWYNNVQGYSGATGAAPAVLPTTSHFKALPNVNELLWYVQNGDFHWDTELWAMMDHLYTGGMWLKKKSKISGYRADQAPDGIDYTRNTTLVVYPAGGVTTGKPSNLSDYFYLPAYGYYYNGMLGYAGIGGFYWSSTPKPESTKEAYYLNVNSSSVSVFYTDRVNGYQLWTAQ